MRLANLTLSLALALALALALSLAHATNSGLVATVPHEPALADLRAGNLSARAAALEPSPVLAPVSVAVAEPATAPASVAVAEAAPAPASVAIPEPAAAPVIAPDPGAEAAPAPAPAPGLVVPMRAAEPIAAVGLAAPGEAAEGAGSGAGTGARTPGVMDLVESVAKVSEALGVVVAGSAGAVDTSVTASAPVAAPAAPSVAEANVTSVAEENVTSVAEAGGGQGGNVTAAGLSLWGGLGIGGGGEKEAEKKKEEDVGMGTGDFGKGRGGGGGGGVVALADTPPSCSDGVCLDLGLKLLEAVEGDSCRSLLSSGRCPKACAVSLADVTQHATWPVCAISCRKDIVEGAAERWAEMCEKHAETLLDQGKDVVKKLQAGTAAKHPVLKVLLGLSVVFAAIGLGYSRGSISAVRAYRTHRRMRMRKSSMETLPLRSGSAGTRFEV